jgi:predicted RNase H-like HicB family nuclease
MTEKYWRVKLIVGVKTYTTGKTEAEALKNAFEIISTHPPIEENIYSCKLIKGKASNPMSEEEMFADNTKW